MKKFLYEVFITIKRILPPIVPNSVKQQKLFSWGKFWLYSQIDSGWKKQNNEFTEKL